MLAILAGVVTAAAWATIDSLAIGSPTSIVWVEPFTLPAETVEPTAEVFVDRLVEQAAALSLRARQIDADWRDVPANDAERLRIERLQGTRATLARALRRALGSGDLRIAGEVTLTPDHADILVRERSTQASLQSRVPRAPQAIERLVSLGAEDLLLLTVPLDAAALILADSTALADTARLGEALAMLERHPSAAAEPRTLALRGAYAAAQGRCREALVHFAQVIESRPRSARIQVAAADCHARLGERERAIERLAAAEQHGKDMPLVLSLAGETYVRMGLPARGLDLLRVAHRRDPGLPINVVAIGEALLALHRAEDARVWLIEHPVDGEWRPRWLGALGLAQVRTGQGPAAEKTAATLRGSDPTSLVALRIEAELAGAMKAWPHALGRYKALRLMSPDDGFARAGEGRALLGLKRPADAIAAYRGCVAVAPWLAECQLGLGIALREADQAEAALEPLREAARLDTADPRIPLETARTLRALLRREQARVHAMRAEALTHKLSQRLALP